MSAANAKVIAFPTERRQARRLVNLTELQELFGGSERWWRYRIASGLPTYRWGKRLRFDPAEVKDWLSEHYGS